jgi:hypothetical protein
MSKKKISRRDFARSAAIAAATAAALPHDLIAQEQKTEPKQPPKPDSEKPKLSPELQAEAEARVENLLRKYGSRLSEEQKAEVRKNITESMAGVEKLRAYPLDNADEPATVLHLERSAR